MTEQARKAAPGPLEAVIWKIIKQIRAAQWNGLSNLADEAEQAIKQNNRGEI